MSLRLVVLRILCSARSLLVAQSQVPMSSDIVLTAKPKSLCYIAAPHFAYHTRSVTLRSSQMLCPDSTSKRCSVEKRGKKWDIVGEEHLYVIVMLESKPSSQHQSEATWGKKEFTYPTNKVSAFEKQISRFRNEGGFNVGYRKIHTQGERMNALSFFTLLANK